jgi:hypothetical protein
MILQISIGIALLFCVYFYIQKTQNPIKETMKNKELELESEKEQEQEQFISSDTFIGSKKGYVFKKDDKGLGYYLDIR